ncbi:hypothetical protein EON65_50815 [archaeon]|nr:MAG: hypothetical protein EON65_50815 [archaeon]
MLAANGYVNGICVTTGATESVKVDWPYLYSYSDSTTCTGSRLVYDYSGSGCIYNGDDDDDYTDYDAYSTFQYVSSGGGSNGLSLGAIAGIVIGAVAGTALIGGVAYFLFVSHGKAPLSSQQTKV